MEGKGLTPHKAEDRTQGKKADQKIEDNLHTPGGTPRKPLIYELLNKFHHHHLRTMIPYKFATVNYILMFIINLLSLNYFLRSIAAKMPAQLNAAPAFRRNRSFTFSSYKPPSCPCTSCSSPAWRPPRRGRASPAPARRRPGYRCSGWPCSKPRCRRRRRPPCPAPPSAR